MKCVKNIILLLKKMKLKKKKLFLLKEIKEWYYYILSNHRGAFGNVFTQLKWVCFESFQEWNAGYADALSAMKEVQNICSETLLGKWKKFYYP